MGVELTLVAAFVSVAAVTSVHFSARRMTGNPWAAPGFAEEFGQWVALSVEGRNDADAGGTDAPAVGVLEQAVAVLTAPVADRRRSLIAV